MKYLIILVILLNDSIVNSSELTVSDNVKFEKNPKSMKTIPSSFENISLGNKSESSCSPKIESWGFRGILLNSPEKVLISSEFVIPLCGSHQLSELFINKFKRYDHEIVIVVTDTKSYKSYSGKLSKPGFKTEEYTKAIGSDEELERNTAGGWFNIDVYDYVRSLPEKEGKYLIYATIGDFKSNVVEVEVEVEKGEAPGPRAPRPNF